MTSSVAALSGAETFDAVKKAMLHKVHSPFPTVVISAMYAGLMIGLGFVFYTTSQVGASGMPTGPAKVLGGVVFSVGLALVIVTGADLFTSACLTQFLVAEGDISLSQMVKHWLTVYFCNMLGAALLVCIIFVSGSAKGSHGAWGAVVLSTAAHKVEHSFSEAVALGIMCNLMVCLAVWMAFAGRTVVDKIVGLTAPVALFVASGFEHSVANMYMIPLALLLKHQDNPEVISATNGLDLSGLTMSGYVVDNLIPVTIGNILGASLVALGMALWHRDRATRKGSVHT
ncbi:formate/nitrite transporter family protein [Corynebacterium epidermidicanis]|uniref:Formate/nitrite transporter family protein n=1 Tax=Corynebacterium epidermidicanis TaxID=1050174 RepID=A0A0G3GTZ3_9CORY|nr:formate/nitrite transporter family protein [Corynebacterium epidermidicanis]AKK03028.1 formate/nitrite transporter family protein [Corynebacterium epidermidicanis]